MIAIFGSAGIGLVIGWLLGKVALKKRLRLIDWLAYITFVGLTLAEVQWLVNWQAMLSCSLAGLLALLFHFLLLRQLQNHP